MRERPRKPEGSPNRQRRAAAARGLAFAAFEGAARGEGGVSRRREVRDGVLEGKKSVSSPPIRCNITALWVQLLVL